MNRQEFVNGLYLDDKGVFDQEINDISLCDLYSLVFKRQDDLTAIPHLSELQLAAYTSVIAGFQETRPQMTMYLDCSADDLITDWIGGVLDKSHSPSEKPEK